MLRLNQIILLAFLLLRTSASEAQVVVAFQGGEGTPADNWNFTPITNAGGPLPPGIIATYPRTGSYAIRAGGGNNAGCTGTTSINCISGGQAIGCALHGKIITFDPVNVACLADVKISAYHRSHIFCSGNGFDSGEYLYFEVRLNGGSWIVVGTLATFGDMTWTYTNSPVGNGPTVPNPFVYNVPAGTNTVQFRVRGVLNRSDEVFYIDDVALTTSTTIYNFPATTGLWNGEVSSDWHNPCNWDSRVLPTATDNVYLPPTANNICEVLPGNTANCRDLWIDMPKLAAESFTSTVNVAGNLIIGTNGELDMSLAGAEGGTLNLEGNWINFRDETFFDEGRSNVVFNGSGNQNISVFSGSLESFYKLRVNKSSGLLTLNDDVWVDPLNLGGASAMLTLSNGFTDLNAYELKVWNDNTAAVSRTGGGLISERTDNSSRLTRLTAANTGNFIFPFVRSDGSYIPFIFNQTSGSADVITASTYSTPSDNLPWPATPVSVNNLASFIGLAPDNRNATADRFWHIDVAGTSTADLTFSYAPAELPAAPYDNPLSLGAQRYDESANAWLPYAPGQGANYFFVSVPGMNAFGTWTLSNNISPLPVELVFFDANMHRNGHVKLNWSTSSEINNDFFSLEKSKDGIEFFSFATVQGAGTTSQPKDYEYFDENPFKGITYYRLKQTDFDGRYSYSDPVAVQNTNPGKSATLIYPNPANDYFYLITDAAYADGEVVISDVQGRRVFSINLSGTSDETESITRINRPSIPDGIYFIRMPDGEVLKLVLN